MPRSAIVTAAVAEWNAKELELRLWDMGINVDASFRDDGVLDMDEKGVTSVSRLSLHYYNMQEAIDPTVEALQEILRPR